MAVPLTHDQCHLLLIGSKQITLNLFRIISPVNLILLSSDTVTERLV